MVRWYLNRSGFDASGCARLVQDGGGPCQCPVEWVVGGQVRAPSGSCGWLCGFVVPLSQPRLLQAMLVVKGGMGDFLVFLQVFYLRL